VEEAAEVKAMRRFDLANVLFKFYHYPFQIGGFNFTDVPLHGLEVKGLAERRPSVLPNDRLIAWGVGETDIEFEGWVVHVSANAVFVKFDLSFPSSDTLFHVRFEFDRMLMRNMHRAVDRCSMEIMWPDAQAGERVPTAAVALQPSSRRLGEVRYVDPDFSQLDVLDEHQRAVILAICRRRGLLQRGIARQAPFLLRGSFGCGKTHTLVQCIRAAVQMDRDARILVCAEANAVADKICTMLGQRMPPEQLFRLNAFFRGAETISAEFVRDGFNLIQYCCIRKAEDGSFVGFDVPSLDSLLAYRVVVSTAATSATLFGVGVGDTHFSHVFIDECAQMVEPLALIPLCLAGPATVVVLCGDELQVGPTIKSQSAKHHSLDKSLMDRLGQGSHHQELYRIPASVGSMECVQLTHRLELNYRSHPRLLELPSRLFNQGRLRAAGTAPDIRSLCAWTGLATPGFPLLFVGVEGEDVRDAGTPSYYNEFEAAEIKRLVRRLVDETNTAQRDVVVIAPFRAQVARIRRLLRSESLGDVKVGPPAVVQGRERRAVFISTVRAMGTQYLHVDEACGLGLLHDPRLVNTVLTRAVALCVVVGDPRLLARHPVWSQVLKYARCGGGVAGAQEGPAGGGEEEREDGEEENTGDPDFFADDALYQSGGSALSSAFLDEVGPATAVQPNACRTGASAFETGRRQATSAALGGEVAADFSGQADLRALQRSHPSQLGLPNPPERLSPHAPSTGPDWSGWAWAPLFSTGASSGPALLYRREGVGAPAFVIRQMVGWDGGRLVTIEFCLFHLVAIPSVVDVLLPEQAPTRVRGGPAGVLVKGCVLIRFFPNPSTLTDAQHFRPPTDAHDPDAAHAAGAGGAGGGWGGGGLPSANSAVAEVLVAPPAHARHLAGQLPAVVQTAPPPAAPLGLAAAAVWLPGALVVVVRDDDGGRSGPG
jgi:helicase MOV-10